MPIIITIIILSMPNPLRWWVRDSIYIGGIYINSFHVKWWCYLCLCTHTYTLGSMHTIILWMRTEITIDFILPCSSRSRDNVVSSPSLSLPPSEVFCTTISIYLLWVDKVSSMPWDVSIMRYIVCIADVQDTYLSMYLCGLELWQTFIVMLW